LWKLGGWIELAFPAAAVVVDGEPSSKVDEAWGAAPTDGLLAAASVRLRGRASIAVHFKAGVRWSFFGPHDGRRRQEPMLVGDDDDDFWSLPPQLGPRTSLLFLFSLRSFVLVGRDSCPPYPSTAYLYLYGLCTLSLSHNTGMFYKKKRCAS